MKRFERNPDGSLTAGLEAEEAVLLQTLAGQVAEVVSAGVAIDQTSFDASASFSNHNSFGMPEPDSDSRISDDPALARLLPDAYPQDAEASAEFRRFTESGLAQRKLTNANTLIRSLNNAKATGCVTLDETEALAWLRSLTDIRLTIAARLGIDTDEDEDGRDIDPMMRDIYDWLGFVQNSLVEALDTPHE